MEHGARYRRQTNCEYQHILFVLDTSGSIGQEDFDRVTGLLGSLTTFFCNKLKIAVMTFDHEYFVEFCFDEHDNTDLGRQNAGIAISSIPYIRPGQGNETRWTHTAGAAQCVCEYMLTPTCGLDDPAADCINVIFVTDGRANDPTLNVCTEIDCLHNRRGVDTFAIGIGNRNELKLECMRENDLRLDEYHLFNFETFDELEEQFQLIIRRLRSPTNTDYLCADTATNPAGRK